MYLVSVFNYNFDYKPCTVTHVGLFRSCDAAEKAVMELVIDGDYVFEGRKYSDFEISNVRVKG